MPETQTRLQSVFERCRAENRAALIPFISAGHPSPEEGDEVLAMLAETGADIIELGVPFSDPLADGPTIQLASQRAIERGVDLAWSLEALRRFRARFDTPVVIFSYLNPVFDYGVERFIADAVEAGADGVLLTDLPVGADAELEARFAESPLELIRLIAPTTEPERAREIAAAARGFIYYISRTGVTGADAKVAEGLEGEVAALRAIAPVPVAVGFGIAGEESARRVAAAAEGVVVGSALVDRLAREGVEAGRELMRSLRAAMPRSGA